MVGYEEHAVLEIDRMSFSIVIVELCILCLKVKSKDFIILVSEEDWSEDTSELMLSGSLCQNA